jgi:hypothetical protein
MQIGEMRTPRNTIERTGNCSNGNMSRSRIALFSSSYLEILPALFPEIHNSNHQRPRKGCPETNGYYQ